MYKLITIVLLIFFPAHLFCQERGSLELPKFVSVPIRFNIPTFIPLVQVDSDVKAVNDTLHYIVNGEFFSGQGLAIPHLLTGSLPLSSPWETMAQLTKALREKDANS